MDHRPPPPQGEEDLSHESRELLNSFPRDKGMISAYVYQYQGFWYPPYQLIHLIKVQNQFLACDTDILLASSPKSGTTWLKSLAFAIVNRNRYTSSQNPMLTNNSHVLVPFLERFSNYSVHMSSAMNLPSPRLYSSHIPYTALPESFRTSKCRIVYICREPKDTFVSLWHFLQKLRPKSLGPLPLEEAFELFCKGVAGYGPFGDHLLEYWKESLERPEKVLFLNYEEMQEDIISQLKKLGEYLAHPFSMEEENQGVIEEIAKMCSFEKMSNLDVNKTGGDLGFEFNMFFRRGQVGDWVNHLTPSMAKRLDQIIEEKLLGSGLTFRRQLTDADV